MSQHVSIRFPTRATALIDEAAREIGATRSDIIREAATDLIEQLIAGHPLGPHLIGDADHILAGKKAPVVFVPDQDGHARIVEFAQRLAMPASSLYLWAAVQYAQSIVGTREVGELRPTPNTKILVGDCRQILRRLPENTFHCCVTSPPFYRLRDFGHDDQIGLEPTLDKYISTLVVVFRAVRRVLRDDATLFLNLGDTHATKSAGTIKPKDLHGVPWRVALALQEDGWQLRSDIILRRTRPPPQAARDRPTSAHDYLFLLAKSKSYFFDDVAVREGEGGSRHVRTVWDAVSTPYPDAHFALMPEEPVRRAILAGTSEHGCCGGCGAPWTRLTDRTKLVQRDSPKTEGYRAAAVGKNKRLRRSGTMVSPPVIRTIGWESTCDCEGDPAPCGVLDPFAGAGTTLLMAQQLGRRALGIELNPEFARMAADRIAGDS